MHGAREALPFATAWLHYSALAMSERCTATMLALAPTWMNWRDAGRVPAPDVNREDSPYGTLRSMPRVAVWR